VNPLALAKSLEGVRLVGSPPVELELTPEQPAAVAAAVAALLAEREPVADSWWQAGIDEALET
jgi:hypothetical protein